MQEVQNIQNNFWGKKMRTHISDFKTYLKGRVSKIVLYWPKNEHIQQ